MLERVISFLAVACSLYAAPITYTMSGTLSGSLNGSVFSDRSVVLTFAGDTLAVTEPPNITNHVVSSTLFISGFGSGTFSDDLIISLARPFPASNLTLLIVRPASIPPGSGMFLGSQSFIDWDLKTPLQPASAYISSAGLQFATT